MSRSHSSVAAAKATSSLTSADTEPLKTALIDSWQVERCPSAEPRDSELLFLSVA